MSKLVNFTVYFYSCYVPSVIVQVVNHCSGIVSVAVVLMM